VLFKPSGGAVSPIQSLLSMDGWVMVVGYELSIMPNAIMFKFYVALNCN